MSDASFEDLFKRITENPELMTKISEIASNKNGFEDALPKIMEAIKPEIASDAQQSDDDKEKTDTSPEKTTANEENPLSLPISKLGEKITKNSKLLIALKPYLSRERGDIIDNVVKLAQIADLMKIAR